MDALEVLECAHLKPGDRLVLRVRDEATWDQVAEMRRQLDATGFSRNDVLIVSGLEEMRVLEAE